MSLKRLICRNEVSFLSAISLILLASVFVRKFARNFLNLHIWISNIPPMGGVEIAGRGSVHLDFIDKECVAGHYMIFDDHIKFCLMSSLAKGSRRYTEGRYVRTVRDCIQEIMGMYRGEKAGARPKPAEKAQATFSTTFP